MDGKTTVERQDIQSQARGKKSVKSKSSMKIKDQVSISAHGTEVGGRKA